MLGKFPSIYQEEIMCMSRNNPAVFQEELMSI